MAASWPFDAGIDGAGPRPARSVRPWRWWSRWWLTWWSTTAGPTTCSRRGRSAAVPPQCSPPQRQQRRLPREQPNISPHGLMIQLGPGTLDRRYHRFSVASPRSGSAQPSIDLGRLGIESTQLLSRSGDGDDLKDRSVVAFLAATMPAASLARPSLSMEASAPSARRRSCEHRSEVDTTARDCARRIDHPPT